MTGSPVLPRVLLKARPTSKQLADRLRAPLPEGLELYLDIADISGDDWLESLAARLAGHCVPADFVWIVEGPLRSLDGKYFDLAREAKADHEVMVRLVECAGRIGAPAVVIHCIALARSADELSNTNRKRALARAEATLARYTELCLQRGVVPTIENVPPVARMREARFAHSLIGMSPDDLLYFADRLPGLRLTCDTSHAQLYLNALAAEPSGLPPELAAVVRYVAGSSRARSLLDYVELLGPRILEAHVSNAAGLLDEGLPYDQGDADLDEAVARLLVWADFLVTEPIEPDPNRGERMREVARRIGAVRARAAAGGQMK